MPRLYKTLCVAALFTSCWPLLALATPLNDEHQQLALIIRQLNAADRLSSSTASTAADPSARHAFDYARFSADLDLIRQGINDYLTPTRAQPRIPPELTGHYTRSSQDQP